MTTNASGPLVILDTPLRKVSLTSTDILIVSIYGLPMTFRVSPGHADAIRALHQEMCEFHNSEQSRYGNELIQPDGYVPSGAIQNGEQCEKSKDRKPRSPEKTPNLPVRSFERGAGTE